MRKHRIKERAFAIVLVLCMVFTMMPTNAYAIEKGDVVDITTGLKNDRTDESDNIAWPIEIYDYHNDGMLFDFASATGDSAVFNQLDKTGEYVYMPDLTTDYFADYTKVAINDTKVVTERFGPWGVTSENASQKTDAVTALKYYSFSALPYRAVDLIDFRDKNSDAALEGYNPSLDAKGNYVFGNAYGYAFKNLTTNTAVNGSTTLVTDVAQYNAYNPNWAANVQLRPLGDGTYEVVKVVNNPKEGFDGDTITPEIAGFTMEDGDIIMISHAAGSKPGSANWMDKVAALALKEGDTVEISADNTTVQVNVPAGVTNPNAEVSVSNKDVQYAVLVYRAANLDATYSVEAFLRTKENHKYFGSDFNMSNTSDWAYCVFDFSEYTLEAEGQTTGPFTNWDEVSADIVSAGIQLHADSTDTDYQLSVSHFAMFDTKGEAEVYGEKALVYNKHHIQEIYPEAEYSTDFTTSEVSATSDSTLETKWFKGAYGLTETTGNTEVDNIYYPYASSGGRGYYRFRSLSGNGLELIDFSDAGGIDKNEAKYAVLVFGPWGFEGNTTFHGFIRGKDQGGNYGTKLYAPDVDFYISNNADDWYYLIFDFSGLDTSEIDNQVFSAGIEYTLPTGVSYQSVIMDISHFALFETEAEAKAYGDQAKIYNNYSGVPTAYYNPIYSNSGYGMLVGSQDSRVNLNSVVDNIRQYETIYDKYDDPLGYNFSQVTDNDATVETWKVDETHVGPNGGIYYLVSGVGSSPERPSGSNYGYTYNGSDLSTLPFDGYTLLQTLNGGSMTAGMLEPTLTEDGTPVYRQEVVDYIAKLLESTLIIPEYREGRFNYDFIRGEKDAMYGDVPGESIDFATALRRCLGINLEENTYDENKANVKLGSWDETNEKAQGLIGVWADCKANIETCYDAAYFMLNNLFVEGSYNELPDDDYDYIVFNKATCEEGREGYIFDAGFTKADETSALHYNVEDKTITLQDMDNKHVYYLSGDEYNYTTLHPFLPITAHNNKEHQTKSPYFADDGVGYEGTYGSTYYKRDFNYVMKSDGEFVYHYEDGLYFEFEGDDDVYLFINGQLVLDIGGIHGITEVEIDINKYVDAARAKVEAGTATARDKALALEEGGTYSFEFFYMERHGFGANCRIHTNMRITDPQMKVDKKAYQGEEIEYGEVVKAQELIKYDFALTNTGNTKLFNMTFTDANIGVKIDYTDGLTVTGNNVSDAQGKELTAEDLEAVVTGFRFAENNEAGTRYDVVAGEMQEQEGGRYVATEPIYVTFENEDALIRFMKTLEGDGLQQDAPDPNAPTVDENNEGSGLWAYSTVVIQGIYYQLTEEQINQMYFDNVLEVTAEAIIDDDPRILRSQDSHRVYIEKELVYYQWKGKDLIVDWENELSEDLENVIPNFKPELIDSVALATTGSPVTTDGRDMTICYNETGTKKFELQINYKNVLTSVDANGDQILDGYFAKENADGTYTFDNVAGHQFVIDYTSAGIAETQKVATNQTQYAAIDTKWATCVLLKSTDVQGQYEVSDIMHGSGSTVNINAIWADGDIVLVVHSAGSALGFANWLNKVAASSLQRGDRVTVSEGITTITVNTDRTVEVEVNVVDVEDSAYVLDYGLSVELSDDIALIDKVTELLPNKTVDARYIALGREDVDHNPNKDGVQAPEYISNQIVFVREKADNLLSDEIKASEGTFNLDISEQSLKYTPTALMDDVDTIYLAMSLCEAGYTLLPETDINKEVRMFKKVSVLPANVVYYEDDFPAITYNKNTENVFSSIGSSSDLSQSVDQNQEYGQDDAYANNSDKSGGSLTQITINEPGQVASFEFTGTGFELISRTNASDSATMTVEVKDDAGTTVANIPVITEFKQADGTGNEVIYQVPVIRLNDLTYGTYTVSISAVPTYAGLEEDGDGNTIVKWTPATLYIDGLRVFQPLAEITEEPIIGGEGNGATSTVVTPGKNEYYKDSEDGAIFTEIRDLILDGKAAVVEYTKDEVNKKLTLSTGTATWTENRNNLTFDGEASYTGSKVPSANEYLMFGPNNEVYMLADDETSAALVFYVQEQQGATVHNLQLALRAIDADLFYGNDSQGTEVKVSYGTYENNDFVWSQAETITSGTEQYYTINYKAAPYIDGKGYQIAIKVNSGMVSYSSIKSNGLDIITLNGEIGEVPDLYYENGILKERETGYAVDASKYPVFTSIKLQLSTDEVGDKPFSEIYVPEDEEESEDMDRIRYQVRDDKDLRLIGFVEDLGAYASISFTLTIGDMTSKELECTTAYSGLYANGTLYSTEDIYGEEGYFVAYTINNYLNYYRGQEVTITTTYTTITGEEVVVERTITVE